MPRGIFPARFQGADVPYVQSIPYTSGQTFKKGALVVFDGSQTLVECGSTPTAATGVALEGAATRPGYDAANSPTVVTGRKAEVSVAMANRTTVFSMRGVNGGTDPVTPAQSNVNVKYGVAKGSDGSWYLNIADTSNLMFEVIDVDIDNKIFFCKFLEAALVLP